MVQLFFFLTEHHSTHGNWSKQEIDYKSVHARIKVNTVKSSAPGQCYFF